jgi:hypothetical protein
MVFDGYLLAEFDTVISDTLHTVRGKEFWTIQMSSHIHTNTVGFLIQDPVKIYDRTMPMEDWLTSVNGWGTQPSFKHYRFFISNLENIASD